MKPKAAIVLFSALSLGLTLANAQEPSSRQAPKFAHYTVEDLGTLGGGPSSLAFGVNRSGEVGGFSQLPSGNLQAFLWRDGYMVDLGTLGGPNSIVAGPADFGNQWALFSDTSITDPLGEDFCGFNTNLICLGALWDGTMWPLPTLGGNNAEAFTANVRGEIVGAAENNTVDASCPLPKVLDFEAVQWGPELGDVRELRPLPGDTVGFALGLNDFGQAVGSSGTCANTTSNSVSGLITGPHAVLWQNGSPINLGTLGGELVSVAAAINNHGEVVGASDLSGDTAAHSFLWTKKSGMQDLGTLGTDPSNFAGWINNKEQIVGWSCDSSGNCRAYLWQSYQMVDLNTLIPADSPLYLILAFGINDDGEIVGQAVDNTTGDLHAFLARPVPPEVSSPSVGQRATSKTTPVVLPENVRALLQKHLPMRTRTLASQ